MAHPVYISNKIVKHYKLLFYNQSHQAILICLDLSLQGFYHVRMQDLQDFDSIGILVYRDFDRVDIFGRVEFYHVKIFGRRDFCSTEFWLFWFSAVWIMSASHGYHIEVVLTEFLTKQNSKPMKNLGGYQCSKGIIGVKRIRLKLYDIVGCNSASIQDYCTTDLLQTDIRI